MPILSNSQNNMISNASCYSPIGQQCQISVHCGAVSGLHASAVGPVCPSQHAIPTSTLNPPTYRPKAEIWPKLRYMGVDGGE